MINIDECQLKRYAAKLLFQFRVNDASAMQPRVCEERIVLVFAASARDAIEAAKAKGIGFQYDYNIDENGRMCYFEFLGIIELLNLKNLKGDDEVWYDICEYIISEETLARLITPVDRLEAIRNEV